MTYETEESFAFKLDKQDPLASYRLKFILPKSKDGNPLLYFAGHSLGLQPQAVKEAIEHQLASWGNFGVHGYLEGSNPWYTWDERLQGLLAPLVGARPSEVVLMNSLTTNLHVMLASFYAPTKERHKILIEDGAFPSDYFAVESQIRHHGFDPKHSMILAKPLPGEDLVRIQTIESILKEQGKEIALVFLPGVNYYTGQVFPMEQITRLGHQHECKVGFDLAHAIGNIPMNLHDWNVDFAVWCNYKYLNSGPGSAGGAFVHERYALDPALPRLAGWWGYHPDTRLQKPTTFVPRAGALGWQFSCPPILSTTPCEVSLQLFREVGIEALRSKSILLTGYLEFLLHQLDSKLITIITSKNSSERGCQLSIRLHKDPKETLQVLGQHDIACDLRDPDVLRVAPIPFYNTFHEVWQFAQVFKKVLLSTTTRL